MEDQKRNRPKAECSDVGVCDSSIGECSCPEGYEGRACERLSCPSSSRVGAGLKV